MSGLHVVINISSSVQTCVMGEERECGREWEEGRMKGQEEEGGIYERGMEGEQGRERRSRGKG